jgi:hypothetical protein
VYLTGSSSLQHFGMEITFMSSKFYLMKALFIFSVSFIAFTSFCFKPAIKTRVSASTEAINITSSNMQEQLAFFRIHRQAKNVVVNWGVTSPAGIAGYTVERSYDGEFFDVINQFSNNNALKFSAKDESVFPGYIYYRIGCVMNNGSTMYSEVRLIRIVQHG